MKKFFALLMAVVMVFALAACGGGEEPADDNGDNGNDVQPPEDDKLVYMVTDMGGVDDESFNQSAWEGLTRFKNEIDGWTADVIESHQEDDYTPNLRAAVSADAELVWAIGYMMAEQLDAVAADNPDGNFAIIDSASEELLDNVAYVVFKEHEGSFLVGMIAGLMTESDTIGFIGGMEGDLIIKFESGFRAGVHAVNPDAEVLVQYADSWGDTARGNQIATNMIGQGADVIYHAAGGVGIGVAEACDDNEVWFIGVDMDQSHLTEYTLTSMIKRVDTATYEISKQLAEGNFPGGTVRDLGLAEEGVGYVQSEHIPSEVIDQVEDLKQKIINGELEVPFTRDAVDEFKANN